MALATAQRSTTSTSTSRSPRVTTSAAPSAVRTDAAPAFISNASPALRLRPGEPIQSDVRERLESSFGVDLGGVRVHRDASANTTSAQLGARAFTLGQNIFLGAQSRPDDVPLMGHEVAHTVQQRNGTRPQTFTSSGGDAHEREANRASEAATRGDSFTVTGRTESPRVQRLGISDALNFFADAANAIPGFRMFTIVIGINPINMSRVERSAANILRAIVEFIPGGNLITRALDTYNVFERVGAWVEQQIRSVGVTGAAIRDALNRFLDSLGWSDIFNLGGVWDRAKRIFTEPIGRLIDLGRGLITGILGFLRDAVLRPLAALAQNTRGYDLLKAVLGRDPITGDAVPRTADTLIGGFMKLIGQEEVWNNLKRANAVARAWAWFQGALSGVMSFVSAIPELIVSTLRSIELADFLPITNLFLKVGRAFGSFVGSFFSWAGEQVMSLLQIIFEVLAPAVMPYIRRAASAFRSIVQNPIGFIGNLVRAGIQGFRQFAGNFLTHLRNSLIQWLTGTLSGANIYIPQAFNLREIIKFVLSVLGLTWQNIRQKLVRAVGETAVRAMETGFEIVMTLVTQGPAAAWERIQESISNLREMVMEQVMTFVRDRIVQAAITRLVTSLNPAGAFIQAIIAIYNTVMFFIERLRQIAQVAMSFIDSIAAIASGAIGAAANRVEQTMGGLLTLVISFLARLVGLGRVSDAVVNIVNRIRAPIERALDRVVQWIRERSRALLSRLLGGDPSASPDQRVERAVAEATQAVNRFGGRRVTAVILRPLLVAIRTRHALTSLDVLVEGGNWAVEAVLNPRRRRRTAAQVDGQTGAPSEPVIAVSAQIQLRSPRGGWSPHPYRVTEVSATQLQYQFAGEGERPASALTRGTSLLSARGESWRPFVAASVPLPEDEIIALNGGSTGTATSWPDFVLAKRVLNYRHHVHQLNPSNMDWEHIVEQSGRGENSVTNLALANRRLNQVDLNHWFGSRQGSGDGFPNTGSQTVRQYLDAVAANAQERARWKRRAYRIFGVSVRPANNGRGPYQKLD